MSRLSFRLRLILAGSVSILLALALATWGLTALFARYVERAAVTDLSNRLESLAVAASVGTAGGQVIDRLLPDPLYERPYSGHYWQVLLGADRLQSRSLWDYELPLPATPLGQGALPGPDGQVLLVVDRIVAPPGNANGVPARITVAVDRHELDRAEADFLADLAPYLAVLCLALIAASAVQVMVGLRPFALLGRRLQALETGRAQRIAGGDLPAEVRPLADRIDQLLAAREAERDQARLRAGDLAHGLKTPLQALLGAAEELRRTGRAEAARAIDETVAQMRAHVDRELTRSRLAAPGSAACDARAVAASVVAVLQRTPEGAGLSWSITGADRLAVALDRADLAEALGALTENAARHARTAVAIDLGAAAGQAVIRVSDDGPGVPQDELSRLQARGVRLDESPGGSGLGLAIASDIAGLSGGRLDLATRNPGFEARLTLPLGPAQDQG